MLCFSISIRAEAVNNGLNKKGLSSDQCTLCHDLIFHLIWSRVHWSLTVLWRIVSSGRFIGLLARNIALLIRQLTVRLLMRPVDNPSVSQRVCSAEFLLSGKPFKESIFTWSRFQRLSCPLAFFCTPGLIHALLQSNNDRVAYIDSFTSLSVGHTTPYHSNRLPSLHLTVFDVPCWNKV